MKQNYRNWLPISSYEFLLNNMNYNFKSKGAYKILFFFKSNFAFLFIEELHYLSIEPVYLHFYHMDNCYQYLGQLLVSVCSYEVYHNKNTPNHGPLVINPLKEHNYWDIQTFTVNFVVLEMNYMPIRADKIKINLSCGGKTFFM